MTPKRIAGIVLTMLGIFLALYCFNMAYSDGQSYSKFACAVAWTEPCTEVNNNMMLGMGLGGVGLVFLATGGILLAKSRSG